jgi:hypothetical protein
MTEEMRDACRKLVITSPRGERRLSREQFSLRFPSAIKDGRLSNELLRGAIAELSPDDLQCVLIIGHAFGFSPDHLDALCQLVGVDWHHSHEDVVSALDKLRSPQTVEALFEATQWIPKSLEYDGTRALAVKAIWALGRIPGVQAEAKLALLARSSNPILRGVAEEQMKRRPM